MSVTNDYLNIDCFFNDGRSLMYSFTYSWKCLRKESRNVLPPPIVRDAFKKNREMYSSTHSSRCLRKESRNILIHLQFDMPPEEIAKCTRLPTVHDAFGRNREMYLSTYSSRAGLEGIAKCTRPPTVRYAFGRNCEMYNSEYGSRFLGKELRTRKGPRHG